MNSVGSISAGIGSDISKLAAGFAQATAIVEGFAKDVQNIKLDLPEVKMPKKSKLPTFIKEVGDNLKDVGGKMTAGVTLPIAAGFGMAVKTAADFEQGLSNIKAVSGATGDEMKQLKDLSLRMGADTKFSALEAAKGIEELMKAGVSTKDILNGGLSGALSLATAGDLELADAAEIASTALNAFKADGLNVTKAADLLAGAANASATDVKELKYGLSMVSAVASGVGMSFKDTSTALAVFAQNGLKGSDAGTSLKTMLMNLQPTTDKQIATFTKLGIITKDGSNRFYDAQGNLKGLSDVAGILQTSLANLNPAQRQMALETMFGSDAIRAGNILYKEGASGVDNMFAAMSKVTAAQVATEKMNNLKGSVEQLKGSLETAGIAIGDKFTPTIKAIADKLTEITNAFMKLDTGTQNSILLSGVVLAAIGPLVWVIGGLAGAMTALATATGLATLQITLIVVGIALLVIGFIWLWQNWSKISKYLMDALFDFFKMWEDTFKNFSKWITEVWNGFFKIIGDAWNSFSKWFTDGWSAFGDGISNVFKGVWDGISGMFKGYVNTYIRLLNFLIGAVNKVKFDFPDWVPGLGGKTFGVNIPTIPLLAAGGIVSSPTLSMIGEAGPEAVIPLAKLDDMLSDGARGSKGNIHINIQGAGDPEEVANAFVRKLKYLGYA